MSRASRKVIHALSKIPNISSIQLFVTRTHPGEIRYKVIQKDEEIVRGEVRVSRFASEKVLRRKAGDVATEVWAHYTSRRASYQGDIPVIVAEDPQSIL